MTGASIKRYDLSNMRQLLVDFPKQINDAVRIGASASVKVTTAKVHNIVITGLGGSAIGGDLLRSYVAEQIDIPFVVSRHYFLPKFVNHNSLVVVSSYSGTTEETIAAYRDAVRRKAQIVCITTNGEVARLAAQHRHPLITIPKGYPPRAALGYSFFPLLVVLAKLKILASRDADIRETVTLLTRQAKMYGSLGAGDRNEAFRIAKILYNKIPIVYSPADRFDVVNLRWRGQMAENAKVLSFGHVVPEMNHNELVGWKVLRRHMAEMAVVFLRDRDEHPRVKLRMEITKEIVGEYAAKVVEAHSEGRSLLAKMFSLVYLGDWISFYLAILNGVDPTPVRVIDFLKGKLGSVK
jgi:glucose/mannose-6-phosphate isomerase